MRALAIVLTFVLAAAALVGCARVRPYQREALAHPGMQSPPWPELDRHQAHVYDVREGSGGATGAAGGGCGCN